MTGTPKRLSILMSIVLVALCLAPMARAADNTDTDARGVRQSFSVEFGTADTGTGANRIEADRTVATAGFNWELGRRGRLDATIPYQRLSTSRGGVEADAMGMKDMRLNYTFRTRELDRSGMSSEWQLRSNIPIGMDGLDQEQNQAVANTAAAAEGFLAPQFGRGLDAGLRHTWKYKKGRQLTSFHLGFLIAGSYDVTDFPGRRTENSGIDVYDLGFRRHIEKGRQLWDIGLRVLVFGSAETTTNNGVTVNTTEVDSDPNYILNLGYTQDHTDRIKSDFRLMYHARDQVDSEQLNVIVNPTSLSLGDRIIWSALLKREDTVHSSWSMGLTGFDVFSSERNGVTVNGSARHETFFRLGYQRTSERGAGWSVDTDTGISDDARDFVVQARYFREF